VWPPIPLILANQTPRLSGNTDVHTAAQSTVQKLHHFVKQRQYKFSIMHRYERISFIACLITVKCGLVTGNLSTLVKINLRVFPISMTFIFNKEIRYGQDET
jgi:hypothetical protein